MQGVSHPGSGKIGYIDHLFMFLQVLPDSGGALPNIEILTGNLPFVTNKQWWSCSHESLVILIFLKDSITVSINVTMAKQRCSKEWPLMKYLFTL